MKIQEKNSQDIPNPIMNIVLGEDQYERKPTKKIKLEEAENHLLPPPQPQPQLQEQLIAQILAPEWIFWKRNDDYVRHENYFAKLNVDYVRLVRSQAPLPSQGIFVFQLQLLTPATVGFGIITNTWIDQQASFIDSRQEESIFYTTFAHGGGVFNINGVHGYKKYTRQKLHLSEGMHINMIINMNQQHIIFVKDEVCAMIPFKQYFQNKQVYPFFQVKNIGAVIQVKRL